MEVRCPKCWCPANLGDDGHNTGCPDHPAATPNDQIQWEQGRRDGFNDKGPVRSSKPYLFGYRVGEAEIDRLVDDEAQSRCFG